MALLPTRQGTVARRYSAWLDLISELLRTSRSFPRDLLLAELARTFRGRAIWAWREPDGSCGFQFDHPIAGWPSRGNQDLWLRTPGTAHPLATWYAATGDPAAMTSARAHRQLHRPGESEALRDPHLPAGLAQQLALPCRLSGSSYRVFVIARPDTDFTDDELALARRVQPLLALLDCHYDEHETACQPGVVQALTGRELSVLDLLSEGCTAAAIAHRLGISPRTVHVHLQNVYRKLGVSDRLLAVRVYRESGRQTMPIGVGPG